MTVPTRTPLGASTLNRKWYLDVNTGTTETPSWVGVFGMLDFKPNLEPTLQDDSDFDSEGYKSQNVTALAWALEFKVGRKTIEGSPTAYDPGQEALRLAGEEMGESNKVHVRWYEMTPDGPRAEAYEGFAAVSWTPEGGGMDANDSAAVMLTGKGRRNAITHPDDADVVATISSLAPNEVAEAGGELVIITGTGFTGATAVEVDGVAVDTDDWEVVSDTKIAFIAPADTGTVPVTVVNAAGESAGSNLTYA